jgi:hypothetical protein
VATGGRAATAIVAIMRIARTVMIGILEVAMEKEAHTKAIGLFEMNGRNTGE